MRSLKELLINLKEYKLVGSDDILIKGLTLDSRAAEPNFLFAAIKGTSHDGHQFIEQAFCKGAEVALINYNYNFLVEKYPHKTFILVPDTSVALGYISNEFYYNPSRKIKLIGVTGTNGKTTVVTLLYKLFHSMGYNVGLISTIAYYIGNEKYDATHTTPDQITLNAILAKMIENNCQYCFMEVSSHACDQNRIAGLLFTGGIFTNLTHDHLDYHKTFENYRDAKKKFFDQLPQSAFALVNVDDRNGLYMLQNTVAKKRTYSLHKAADFRATVLESNINGLVMKFGKDEVHFRLSGYFNASNLLAVYGAAIELGMPQQDVLQVLSNLEGAEGRFQFVENNKNVFAIVDYAHTPDAVENVIKAINQFRKGNEQFIIVIGAGGDRDVSKRPIIAKIAALNANLLILTSDNPRSEDPKKIINDMKSGLNAELLKKTLIIEDRYNAIKTACTIARAGDIILVAGKGHEKYQEINGVKYPFDDIALVREFLKA